MNDKINIKESPIYKILPMIYICIVILIIFTFILTIYLSYKITPAINITKYDLDNNTIQFYIDDINIKGNALSIFGWAFKIGEDIKLYKSNYVLYDEMEDKYIKLNTKMVIRPEVAEKLEINNDIKHCGMHSMVDIKNFDKNHTYKLYILYENNNNKLLKNTDKEIKFK